MPKIAFNESSRLTILTSLRAGNTLKVSANRAGISERTLTNWIKKGKEEVETHHAQFAQDVAREQAEWQAEILNNIQMDGNAKVNLDVLSRRDPKNWAATSRVISIVNDKLGEFSDYMIEELTDEPELLKRFLELAANFDFADTDS